MNLWFSCVDETGEFSESDLMRERFLSPRVPLERNLSSTPKQWDIFIKVSVMWCNKFADFWWIEDFFLPLRCLITETFMAESQSCWSLCGAHSLSGLSEMNFESVNAAVESLIAGLVWLMERLSGSEVVGTKDGVWLLMKPDVWCG